MDAARTAQDVPEAPEQIVAEAGACARAGATGDYFHAYDIAIGEQTTDLARVTRII